MINLDIKYNIDLETKRVTSTLDKKDWYESNGYKITLPKESVENEYKNEIYDEYKNEIENQWGKYDLYIQSLKDLPFRFNNNYTVILTRYGVGGSYSSQTGEIIINIDQKQKEIILGTLIHEMIHISIEPLIKKYKVKHWYKERLVDLICNKYFSDIRKPQTIKEDVSEVDELFNIHFPNLEVITKLLGQ